MVQDPFTQMVARDITGTATPEESNFLRQDQNLAAWTVKIEAYLSKLDYEMKAKKTEAFDTREREGARSPVTLAAFRRSLAFEHEAIDLKRVAKLRLAESRQLKRERVCAKRLLLQDVGKFLAEDELFTEEAAPIREELLDRVGKALSLASKEAPAA